MHSGGMGGASVIINILLRKLVKWVLNCLHSWKVNHVKRNLNEVVHRLAKEALSLTVEKELIKEIPICISDIISIELCA